MECFNNIYIYEPFASMVLPLHFLTAFNQWIFVVVTFSELCQKGIEQYYKEVMSPCSKTARVMQVLYFTRLYHQLVMTPYGGK